MAIKKFVNGDPCDFKEIDIKELLMDDEKFRDEKHQTKNDWLNSIFKSSKNRMEDFGGCYVFQMAVDCKLDKAFFDSLALYVKDGTTVTGYKKIDFFIASSKSRDFPADNQLHKDCLLYVGKAEANIFGRIREHLTNDKFNGNRSLKLGFSDRNSLVSKIKCLVALKIENDPTSCRKMEEKVRTKFGSYFGER